MLRDATIVTDFECSGIHKADAATLAKTRAQVSTHRHERVRNPFNKALIAYQLWKRICPVDLYFLLVIGFEIAVARLMKPNQNRHDFAQTQVAAAIANLESKSQQLLFPLRFKGLAKIIDGAEQVF